MTSAVEAVRAEGAAKRLHYQLIFWLLAGGIMSYTLLMSMVAPALPQFQREYGVSVNAVSWMMTAYLVSSAIATPLIGRLGDMYGKQRLLVMVLATLGAGAFVSALANSLPVMLVGRTMQGVVGGMFPLIFGIIREEFPSERVPGAIGLISALSAVSGGAGVALAGPIVSNLGLHFLFWLPLAAIVPITIAINRLVPPSRVHAPGRVNWRAALLMSIGLSAILLAVSMTPVWHWLSFKTLGLIALGLVVLAVWVLSEARSPAPLIDMKMMRVRGIWTCNAFAVTLGVGLYVTYILIPEYVEVPERLGYGFGASLTGAGLFLVPMTLAVFVSGSQMGRLEKRFGSKRPVLLAGLSIMASYILMALARSHPWEMYVEPILLGAGIGIAFAGSVNLLVENCAPEQTGEVTGMNAVARLIGGAFGAAAVASILASATGPSGYPSQHGFTVAFLVCGAAIGVGVLIGLLIPERRRRVQALDEALAVSASAVVPGAVPGEP